MKKISYLGLAFLAVAGFSSCKEDKDPQIDTNREFKYVLNVPQFADQFIDLSTEGVMTFTVSQPEYGVTVVPTYGLEISLTPDFTPVKDFTWTDEDGVDHVVPGFYALTLDSQLQGVLLARMDDIAAGINQLEGLFNEELYREQYPEDGMGYLGPLYVRSTAYLGSGTAAIATATVSNVVKLAQVQGYASFPSSELLLSVPGNANSWNHLPQILYVGDSEDGTAMIFKGFAVIDGEFKVTDGDWDGAGNWGATEKGLKLEEDGTYSATLIQNSQDNFNKDGLLVPGLYYLYVELTDMKSENDNAEVGTMIITPIESICVQGNYCGWEFDGAVQMEADGTYFTWTASGSFTSAGWKFAMNNSWSINLGGDIENLSFDGGDILKDASMVTLNLEQYPWTCTVQ